MQSTILLSVAPPEIRGRVMGLLAVSVGTMPLGILYAGFLADWLGAPTGLALVAGQGLFLWLLAAPLAAQRETATIGRKKFIARRRNDTERESPNQT